MNAGVPEPYNIHARENEESAILVLTKADFEDVISHYPEQNDVVLSNVLMQYGLTRTGADIACNCSDQRVDEEGYQRLRAAIQVLICNGMTIFGVTLASSGHY